MEVVKIQWIDSCASNMNWTLMDELDFIWKNIDHLDDRIFGDASKRATIMRLYSMGIPYRALMSAYEGLNPNECYQKIYEWACKKP